MNEENKAGDPQKITLQNVAQEMLPNDLKKNFVLQKNSGTLGTNTGNAANSASPSGIPSAQLDPNMVQKPIRTFESDLAEALAKKQGSSAAISIAESKKKDEDARRKEMAANAAVVAAEMKSAQNGTTGERSPTQSQPEQRQFVRPIAPTRATAIPGATISIPPTMQREVTDEIEVALMKARPPAPPVPPPAFTTQPVPEQPIPKPRPVVQVPPAAPMKVMQQKDTRPRRSILKPILLTLVSLLLISGGVVAAYFLYVKLSVIEPTVAPTPLAIPSIIQSDSKINFTVENAIVGNILISQMYSQLNKAPAGQDKIVKLSLNQMNGSILKPLTGSEFLNKLDTHVPDVLFRSITDRWMFGTYGEADGTKTSFMALTTDFFQNAFAGMLMWENDSLADDVALLLNFKDRARKDDLNSTSTLASYFTIRGQYSDRVIRNRDVREFRSPQGELLFLYSFINKETLIITTTESSFEAIIDRIEKDAYVR